MSALVLIACVTLALVIGVYIGQRSPAVCIVGTCCARATRCEAHAKAPEGILLPGWRCSCGIFNGEAKDRVTACRACGGPR